MNIIKYYKLVRGRIPEIIESAGKRRICDEKLMAYCPSEVSPEVLP